MPNWCHNKIIIRGSKKQREEFKEKYCELVNIPYHDEKIWSLDFNKVIPEPKTIKECPKKYLIRNAEEAEKRHLEYDESNERKWFDWYQYHCDNWGCKWEGDPDNSEECESSLTIKFYTPWGPPYKIISKLIKDNPELKITGRFDEPNMDLHMSFSYKTWNMD